MNGIVYTGWDVHTGFIDNLIWHTIGPKSFLLGTAEFFFGPVAQVTMIILSLTALTLC